MVSSPAQLLRLLFCVSCSMLCLVLIRPALTQSCTPPTTDTVPGWAKNSTVYVDFSNLNAEQKRQVQLALDAWNTANRSNGSGVVFSNNAPPTGALTLKFSVGPTPVDSRTGQPAPAITDRATDSLGNRSNSNITFSNNSMAVGPDGQQHLTLDETASTDAFTKAALHELGHTMG